MFSACYKVPVKYNMNSWNFTLHLLENVCEGPVLHPHILWVSGSYRASIIVDANTWIELYIHKFLSQLPYSANMSVCLCRNYHRVIWKNVRNDLPSCAELPRTHVGLHAVLQNICLWSCRDNLRDAYKFSTRNIRPWQGPQNEIPPRASISVAVLILSTVRELRQRVVQLLKVPSNTLAQ